MIRITEDNDWVLFIILGSILIFIIVMQYLQRESGVVKFFTQSYTDTGNIFPSWSLISIAYITLLSALVSQFVPVVPFFLRNVDVFGFQLNRFGVTFITFCAFYFIKFFFSFLFYNSIGQDKKWERLYFVSSKYYFAISILLIVLNITTYYFSIDGLLFLRILLVSVPIVFIFKILFYIFNRNHILPKEWHYKFLYICTLQFAPLLAVWKLLFS